MMNRYQWQQPITTEMMQALAERISRFFEKDYRRNRTCETCVNMGKSDNCGGHTAE